jgi:prepilin-type N-terminal cleavage/methylation domain-containing protein
MTKQKYTPGFTLVEMLVSIAIFSIVMVVALGALLSMSVATRKAEAINSAVNNLSASIESMSRSIRTGAIYHCGSSGSQGNTQDCVAAPQPYFTYIGYDGRQVTYCLSNPGATTCNTSTTCSAGTCSVLRSINNGAFSALTAPEVRVTNFGFYVTGSTEGDTVQPKVVLFISGTVSVTATQNSNFTIQTAVAQRIFDL